MFLFCCPPARAPPCCAVLNDSLSAWMARILRFASLLGPAAADGEVAAAGADVDLDEEDWYRRDAKDGRDK